MALLTLSEVYDEITRAQAAGRKLAIANIVTTAGSTPQGKGAKLIVHEDGRMQGTVGGGCVEADVWAEAKEALYDNAARMCFFTLRDNPDVPPDEEGMVCGGEMEVFIEVWSPKFQPVLTAAVTAEYLRQAEAAGLRRRANARHSRRRLRRSRCLGRSPRSHQRKQTASVQIYSARQPRRAA